MTDGPFKNSKLPKLWRQFGDAVQNDAVDDEERRARASHAILIEMLTETPALFAELQEFVSRQQLDLEAASLTRAIFDNHIKTSVADLLKKELVFRLSEGVPPKDALSKAVEETVRGHTSEAKSHFHEDCIRATEAGEMGQDQCDRTVSCANAIFDSLSPAAIRDAVITGNKNAFQQALKKKEGLDEGPTL